jgi:hypothetical protein
VTGKPNIGVADVTSPLDVSYLLVFALANNATNATIQTTDPGRALITGKWADIGKVKGPISADLQAARLTFDMSLWDVYENVKYGTFFENHYRQKG